MKIDNIKVYGLAESIVASGLPMVENYDEKKFQIDRSFIFKDIETTELDADFKKHLQRSIKLASCKVGESHDCFLCGIIVQMNVTAPRYWWPEFQRYHFADIVSSTSTMHRLKAFVKKAYNLANNGDYASVKKEIGLHFSPDTREDIVDVFINIASVMFMQDNFNLEVLKANLPDGWLQTARITTNYRQLKTIYRQRLNHRLKEWQDFCHLLTSNLPIPELFTTSKEEGK